MLKTSFYHIYQVTIYFFEHKIENVRKHEELHFHFVFSLKNIFMKLFNNIFNLSRYSAKTDFFLNLNKFLFHHKTNIIYFHIGFFKFLSRNLNLPAIDIYNMTFDIQFLHDQYCLSATNIHRHNIRIEHSFPIGRISCMSKKI